LSLTSSPDIFNRSLGKGLNTTDLPHQFRLSAEYTVPRLHGSNILGNKVVSYVLGDWGLGWYMSYQSAPMLGRPSSTTNTSITSFLGRSSAGSAQYNGGELWSTNWTDYAGVHHTDPIDINCHCFDPTKTIVFNSAIGNGTTDTWTNIPDGQWGAQQSSSFLRGFRGIRLPQENANVSRNFRLKERLNLQIRVEFTNVFNRTQLPQPSITGTNFSALPTTISSGVYKGGLNTGYGVINPTSGTANSRTGLLVARLTF
jgi:hypothetical protein